MQELDQFHFGVCEPIMCIVLQLWVGNDHCLCLMSSICPPCVCVPLVFVCHSGLCVVACLPYGGGGPFCQFWVGLVGPLFKISFFPTRKVFKIPGGWVSEITPPAPPVGKQRPGATVLASNLIRIAHLCTMHSVARKQRLCPSNTRHWFRRFLASYHCLPRWGRGGKSVG